VVNKDFQINDDDEFFLSTNCFSSVMLLETGLPSSDTALLNCRSISERSNNDLVVSLRQLR